MKTQRNRRNGKGTHQDVTQSRPKKKPYVAPQMERLGSLTEMTRGVGGGYMDGGWTSAY